MKVCVVSEGGYPITRGGLAEWVHQLIGRLKDVEFEIFCVTASKLDKPVYPRLENVNNVVIFPFMGDSKKKSRPLPRKIEKELAEILTSNLQGDALDMERFCEIAIRYKLDKQWVYSKTYWHFLTEYYDKSHPEGSFVEFFWALLGIHSIILDNLRAPYDIPEADVYHALSTGFAGFSASIAKAVYKKPIVLTEQGLYLKERRMELDRMNVSQWYRDQFNTFSESVVRTSFKYSDSVALPCRAHIPFEKTMGLEEARVRIINNGLECDKFIPTDHRNGNPPVVGCFARVVAVKGLEVLIEAARRVREKYPAEFVVVGEVQDKEYHEQCKRLVQEAGLGDHFKFIGHTNPLQWYHKVDVFTLSSHSEGVPYALLEAMSCGLPAVCTSVGGIPEIITDKTGFVVPPNDPAKLSEKLMDLITNKDLRLTMGNNARRRALDKYTLDEMARSFKNLYEELTYGNRKN